MKYKIDRELLYRYLDGSFTPDDETVIKKWLDTDDRNRDHLNRLKKIWDTPEIPLPAPDMEQAWLNITDKIAIKQQAARKKFSLKQIIDSIVSLRPFFRYRMVPVTACILFLFISIYFLLTSLQPVKMNAVTIGHAQQETINLSDGTRLTLDAGSTFQYPEKFSNSKREVYLHGEGFFRVAHDPDRPFIIHANGAFITVLGTEFNVRAWDQNKKVVVAVVKGTVALRGEISGGEVLIQDKQYSILNDSQHPSLPHEWDGISHISWMQREFYFQSSPLREVLDQLQRWYDVTFELPDEQAATNQVTVLVRDMPIEEILNLLALINNFEYEQRSNKIIFSRKR
jgi:transmembrane sensor